MRRVRCIVCFTGAAFDVPVTPAANRQQVTVDDLVRQLQEQESVARGAPIRIDVVTDGSGTFGPPRGLAPDDELPSSNDPANVFLVFASKYVDRFPRAKIETAALVNEHHARQVLAYGCMLAPADHHLKTSLDEFSRAHACAQAIAQDFEARVVALPEAMRALGRVRLVSDPESTLAQRVGDFGGLVDSGKSELAHASEGLTRTKAKYDAIQQRLAECRDVAPAAAGSASQSHIDAMSRAIEERIEALKGLLKSTERVRLDVGKLLQGVKAVRDGVLLKMSMIAALPEAYAAAIQLARRRLTFNKAAVRIRQMLAVEHGAICDDTAAFVAQFGSRFPTNIVPGIATKPPLPTFDDPVADVLRPHMVDLEEDPVSELLARLGIGRAASRPPAPAQQSPKSAVAGAEEELARQRASHASELAVLRAELVSVRSELDAGEAKHRQTREELRSAQTRAEEAESDAARYQQERAMFAEARDGLQKQLDALTKKFAEATEQLDQRDGSSSAQCVVLETRVSELTSQVEALQTSLESADANSRRHESELESEKAELTEMAGRLSEQSDELEQALAVVKAERSAREVVEFRSRKVAVASAYHVLTADEQAARAHIMADAAAAFLDTHSQLLQSTAVLRTTAAGAGSPAPPAPEAPAASIPAAASGDALSAVGSASFGRTITLSPANFAALEAEHSAANGQVDHEALHLALFKELHFEMRPLKFTAVLDKVGMMGLGRERVFLDADRNGFVVRAAYDPVKDAAVVERAKRDRFVFGQLVVITNTQRSDEGKIVITGHVSFIQ